MLMKTTFLHRSILIPFALCHSEPFALCHSEAKAEESHPYAQDRLREESNAEEAKILRLRLRMSDLQPVSYINFPP